MKTTSHFLAICAACLLAGCATGTLHRPVAGGNGSSFPQIEYLPKDSSKTRPKTPLAFIELNAKGELLQPEQVDATLQVLRRTARTIAVKGGERKVPVVLVTFVHGWKHSTLSGNVREFRDFLEHLAKAGTVGNRFDVMGVYLSWPGAAWGPLQRITKEHQKKESWAIPILAPILAAVPEQFTVWNRFKVALDVADGGEVAPLVARLSRAVHEQNSRSLSIVSGHSMGGLIMERAVVEPLAAGKAFQTREDRPDLVFLMNSAAPARLAQRAVHRFEKRSAPKELCIVSVTSLADPITHLPIKIALKLNWWGSFTRRIEKDSNTGQNDTDTPDKRRHLFFAPRDADDLHTHEMRGAECPLDPDKARNRVEHGKWLLSSNLRLDPDTDVLARELGPLDLVAESPETGMLKKWHFYPTSDRKHRAGSTPYWIISTGPSLIGSHGDIWDTQAVSVMAATIREAGLLGEKSAKR